MPSALKRLASRILIPATQWYLRKERTFRHGDIVVKIKPGVFHPGLFSSTLFLIKHLHTISLEGKTLLEPGCGTGMISIFAARRGALVTALDINPVAVTNTLENAALNDTPIRVLQSDLFTRLSPRHFDVVVLNPPYYAKDPKSDADHAWYCGARFEYFQKLFSTLSDYIHEGTEVVMVLTRGCDIARITAIAESNGYRMNLFMEKPVLFDRKNFLFRIVRSSP